MDSLYATQRFVPAHGQFVKKPGRRFIDDLPAASASRLRALGIITPEMTEFVVRLGDVEQLVAVRLRKFPNGGSWSLFDCPTCERRAQVLRALNGVLVCWRCCFRCGVRYRCEPATPGQRADRRLPRLRAMLESKESVRLRPHLWGTLERRRQLEATLARCEYIVSKGRRFRDVAERTPEIPPEPIARPKIKSIRKR